MSTADDDAYGFIYYLGYTWPTTLDNSPYELVSPFYGQGVMACWLLAFLSCVVSWAVDPRKRASDSIDIAFIAVLVFSIVAAGHLIVQLLRFPTVSEAWDLGLIGAAHLVKLGALLQASMAIVEESTLRLAFLLCVIPLRWYARRLSLLSMAAVVNGIAVVLYFIKTSYPDSRNGHKQHLLHVITHSLTLSMLFLGIGMRYIFNSEPSEAIVNESTGAIPRQSRTGTLLFYSDLALRYLCILLAVLLGYNMEGYCLPFYQGLIKKTECRKLWPLTVKSMEEPDQAAAVLIGSVLFGFKIYEAVSAQRQEELDEQREQQLQDNPTPW
ncbi:MAG: hypothetical protein Q9212_001828 [Teloschistes hypoglaucus]